MTTFSHEIISMQPTRYWRQTSAYTCNLSREMRYAWCKRPIKYNCLLVTLLPFWRVWFDPIWSNFLRSPIIRILCTHSKSYFRQAFIYTSMLVTVSFLQLLLADKRLTFVYLTVWSVSSASTLRVFIFVFFTYFIGICVYGDLAYRSCEW